MHFLDIFYPVSVANVLNLFQIRSVNRDNFERETEFYSQFAVPRVRRGTLKDLSALEIKEEEYDALQYLIVFVSSRLSPNQIMRYI